VIDMPDVDVQLMTRALELARGGDPSPNPHVGSVVARGATIVGEGFHEAAGLEHAEIVAIRAAGAAATGATLYVTLEPCNHEGRTPPCVDTILASGISRVVIGCRDPNPTVRGGGVERLQEAGIEVTLSVMEKDCRQLIKPWTKYITEGMSYLSLKLALSLDGRIATRTGASKWITCPESRSRVQHLRARCAWPSTASCAFRPTASWSRPRMKPKPASSRPNKRHAPWPRRSRTSVWPSSACRRPPRGAAT
jgi:diaminohydroxyphosphoribosylaminopyrimidine deaminase/5-amino-6-(5-phosphoribosylamino)uracil reductase